MIEHPYTEGARKATIRLLLDQLRQETEWERGFFSYMTQISSMKENWPIRKLILEGFDCGKSDDEILSEVWEMVNSA